MNEHVHGRAAYQRLKRRGESCDGCKAAVAAQARERRAAKKSPKPVEEASRAHEQRREPQNVGHSLYARDPTPKHDDDLEDAEVPGPPWMKSIAIEAARLKKEPAEPGPAEPEVHRVQMAVVARGKIDGYADERFAPPNVVYEDLPPDVPQSWIGTPPSMRRRRPLPWHGR